MKDIPGFEGEYAATEDGQFWSHKTQRFLKLQSHPQGYKMVRYYSKGKPRMSLMHRFVGITYIPNPNNWPEINHKNFNKMDNRVENLEWVTRLKNQQHAVSNGHHRWAGYIKS